MINSPSTFQRNLLAWFRQHGRAQLPWRHTSDPYAILVSEFMLQQTQVATVIPYFQRWLRRFPDFETLARASESEVLHAWQGLGYYARARNLHATAKAVVHDHRGTFPRDPATMRTLPGLGRYTANAVATFAFNQAVPIVEANIGRVLARWSNMQLPIDSAAGLDRIWGLATELLPKRNPAHFNTALMDLGALVCTARQPKCELCPVRASCAAENPATLPIKKPRAATKLLTERHAFSFDRGRLLLEQSSERWRGMWILPRLTSAAKTKTPLYLAEFPFTNHRITLAVYQQHAAPTAPGSWFPLDVLASIPLPSPHRRAVTHLIASAARAA
ncbi:MAG: A/G-specific adenine glycosylase [Chthoniobacterales bacterium]